MAPSPNSGSHQYAYQHEPVLKRASSIIGRRRKSPGSALTLRGLAQETETPMHHNRRTRALLALALAVTLAGCATQDDVRSVCRDHGGVQAANGNAFRKFVSCRDGFYKTVR